MTDDEFAQVVERCWPREVACARARLRKAGIEFEAEDLMQNVLARMWSTGKYAVLEHATRNPNMTPADAVRWYIRRSMFHRVVDRLRSRRTSSVKRVRRAHTDLAYTMQQTSREDTGRESAVAQAMSTLTDEGRAAVQLVDMEGFENTEASEILEIPGRTLRRRLAGARHALRVALVDFQGRTCKCAVLGMAHRPEQCTAITAARGQ